MSEVESVCFLDPRHPGGKKAEIVTRLYYNRTLKKDVPEFGIRVSGEKGIWWYPYKGEYKMIEVVLHSLERRGARINGAKEFIEVLKRYL